MQDAMTSASKIMNDDIEGAEADLRKGSSAFHALGLGITTFMRSVLGFEKEVMAEASKKLSECETLSLAEQKKAEKAGVGDKIYPAGSEYALVHAEAQLMGAMVAVLHESYLEAAKGFWGLRGAYATLDKMMQAEEAYLKKKGVQLGGGRDKLPPARTLEQEEAKPALDEDEDADLEFVEAPDHQSGAVTPLQYEGHLSSDVKDAEKKLEGLSLNKKSETTAATEQQDLLDSQVLPTEGPEAEIFTDTIDEFVHSGANMCFGILLLMISMIPPSFAKLLSIIGFRGDRERGIRMLWQSSRFNNINGAVAGLVLLGYYNGLLGFADILPSEEEAENGAIVGYPRHRCSDLLARMVKSYPESRLWRMEEARGLSNSRNLTGAIELLMKNTDSKMRQVRALNLFELSLDTMYVGQFQAMYKYFDLCSDENDWSHSLYAFLGGCARLELYRDAFGIQGRDKVQEAQMLEHKKEAEKLFREAPTLGGKKKFMSRPLPFEEFVRRKVQKWDKRSVELGIDLVDAIGVSPVQEMVYLWNGIKKMQPVELERVAQMLSWNRLTVTYKKAQNNENKARDSEDKAPNGDKDSEDVAGRIRTEKIMAEDDEIAVFNVCLAAVYRSLGRLDEAKELLEVVLAIDK